MVAQPLASQRSRKLAGCPAEFAVALLHLFIKEGCQNNAGCAFLLVEVTALLAFRQFIVSSLRLVLSLSMFALLCLWGLSCLAVGNQIDIRAR